MTVYASFAEILDYPEHLVAEAVGNCIAGLGVEDSEACALLQDFQTATAGKDIGELQELYTNAFDLRPECTLNLGYHMFGDDGRRGVFLAELKGRMEARGISLGVELADYLCLILRYLDVAEEERAPVVEFCLLPSMSRMMEVLGPSGNPYQYALHALLSLLRRQHDAIAVSAEAVEA